MPASDLTSLRPGDDVADNDDNIVLWLLIEPVPDPCTHSGLGLRDVTLLVFCHLSHIRQVLVCLMKVPCVVVCI